MSAQLRDNKNSFVLENEFVKIEVSKKDSLVLSIVEKKTGDSILSDEKTFFFQAFDSEEQGFNTTGVSFDGNIATVMTDAGEIKVKIEAFDDHFIFEIVSKCFPKDVFYFDFASMKYTYNLKDNTALRAAGVAMTINVNPRFYPSGSGAHAAAIKKPESGARVYEYLGDGSRGAKYGLTIVPATILRESLKVVYEKVDSEKGLVSKTAGAWTKDNRIAYGDYTIDHNTTLEHLEECMPFYKFAGVDQIDFHQNTAKSFRQGDFKFAHYEDATDFKNNVTSYLEENGIQTGLHTYAYYINPNCPMLADPKVQAQLDREEVFTLAEDIDEDTMVIPTVESTADLSTYYGFFTRNLPFALIGDEIFEYRNLPQGFRIIKRGAACTTAKKHKKGEKIIHLIGCFNWFSPKPSSDLFKEIARNTAKTYNEGGFSMIYLDALDGISRHTNKHEGWYYCALFVHEIVKNCIKSPIIEYSTMYPSIYAARARMGATDTPYRAYKYWNMFHHRENIPFINQHLACTLGWYNFYPMTDKYPGNQHTKYQHCDDIDFMGTMAIVNDYSTTLDGTPAMLERYKGFKRNIELYKKYNDLRKSGYFSKELLSKLNGYEYKLIEKAGGKFAFVEKHYDKKRYYSLLEENRNTAEFENPFKKQTPFVRIEHCMSTLGQDEMIILPMNENAPVASQVKVHEFGGEIDTTEKLAFKVRVKGNGKKGAVGIKTRCASASEFGYGLYIIETDFEGWRDFVLLEADNGDRPDLSFDKSEKHYPIYRSGLNMDRLTKIELEVDGDVEGVLMSSISICRQTYNVWKNPTVKIGDESVMFECELMSTDFIEWDGETAKVIDRYGNEKPIWFTGNVTAKKGKFKVSLAGASLNACPVNAYLTLGFTGCEVK